MAYRQSTTSRNFSIRSFTIVELLVVIVVISLLASLLFSSLFLAKQKAQQIQCLNNLRQIEITRQLYSLDNNKIVANGLIEEADINRPIWVQGHLNNLISREVTNSSLMFDNKFALFADYLPKSKIYKCPSDRKKFKLISSSKRFEKVRNYGLNWHLGLFELDEGRLDILEFGVIRKEDNIISPANTFTFVDTNPESVCWPVFGIYDRLFSFMFPSYLHNKGGNLAFADGHLERRKWLDERTNLSQDEKEWHSHWNRMDNNKDFEWLVSKRGL